MPTVVHKGASWFFSDADGKPLVSIGVTTATFQGQSIRNTKVFPYGDACRKKHSTEEAWRKATAERLRAWGLNTVGPWSDAKLAAEVAGGRRMLWTQDLNFGSTFAEKGGDGWMAWVRGIPPDLFDPAFEAHCRARAKERCAPHRDDPQLLGYFLDNELRWGPDWRSNEELLMTYLNFAETVPGRAAAFAFLKNRHGEIAKLNAAWGTAFASWEAMTRMGKFTQPFHRTRSGKENDAARQAAGEGFLKDCDDFLRQCAERYFRITAEAIKANDPNHLNLGARFPFMPGRAVVEEAVKRVDVLSIGGYGEDPTPRLRELDGFDVPILIGEFSFRAKDSGLPNTQGAGPLLATQTDRANAYERYVTAALADPRVVGIHWYCWADEPKEGRADGENSNFGLVNIHDEPYEVLVKKMTEVNGKVQAVRNGR